MFALSFLSSEPTENISSFSSSRSLIISSRLISRCGGAAAHALAGDGPSLSAASTVTCDVREMTAIMILVMNMFVVKCTECCGKLNYMCYHRIRPLIASARVLACPWL